MHRRLAALTVDLEDYRRQELRDCLGGEIPPHPAEVEHSSMPSWSSSTTVTPTLRSSRSAGWHRSCRAVAGPPS